MIGASAIAVFAGGNSTSQANLIPCSRYWMRAHWHIPGFSGNKLYNSLGNILVNPHIGMLLVAF